MSRETQRKKLEIVSEDHGWPNIERESEIVKFSRAQSRAQSRAHSRGRNPGYLGILMTMPNPETKSAGKKNMTVIKTHLQPTDDPDKSQNTPLSSALGDTSPAFTPISKVDRLRAFQRP